MGWEALVAEEETDLVECLIQARIGSEYLPPAWMRIQKRKVYMRVIAKVSVERLKVFLDPRTIRLWFVKVQVKVT